jgi:hypothetical protein
MLDGLSGLAEGRVTGVITSYLINAISNWYDEYLRACMRVH